MASVLRSPFSAENATAMQAGPQLPVNILDAFLPGYSMISGFILHTFGFDISILVSLAVVGAAIITSGRYCFQWAASMVNRFYTASITVSGSEDIQEQLIQWVSNQPVCHESRSLRAIDGWLRPGDLQDEEVGPLSTDTNALLNFNNWEALVRPRYEPHRSSRWFWHAGHYFHFTREKEAVAPAYPVYGANMTTSQEETLIVTVLGRSTEPIKRLILEARAAALAKDKSCTTIRRPTAKQSRHHGMYPWTRVAVRPSRGVDTVVLDHAQKVAILRDINEYLHPATARWYANRGIPYRRGYLFHGPPGTGKTSLSFAIAGVFGLDIFCISLLEPTLTEEDLGHLFSSLPRRCVVLLEDIDSAGLVRHPKKIQADKTAMADQSANTKEGSNNISLSGLLNAIDGVASHEGRVLVMTTNHADQLDEALTRPGRVDMLIGFTLATREQIRDIFMRMYLREPKNGSHSATITAPVNLAPKHEELVRLRAPPSPVSSSASAASSVSTSTSVFSENTRATSVCAPEMADAPAVDEHPKKSATRSLSPASATLRHDPYHIHDDEILVLADAFASRFLDEIFSPAEVQGFLLMRKTDPRRAVEEAEAWRDEMLTIKKRRAEKAREQTA